ncbi:MAG: hypothetical protein ACRD3H_06685, partial [Terriglobales bacterium]
VQGAEIVTSESPLAKSFNHAAQANHPFYTSWVPYRLTGTFKLHHYQKFGAIQLSIAPSP